jgi:hypothetical protein
MNSGEDVSEKTSIVTGETFNGNLKQAEQSPAALVVLMGPQEYVGKQFPLTSPEYIVGRNPEIKVSAAATHV